MPEQKAFVSEDRSKKEVSFSPIGQNNCFLCSREVGESDPRQFYSPPQNPSAIMLGHTGCINQFKAHGEVWPPPEPEQPAPKVDALGEVRRVVFGDVRVTFGPHYLAVQSDEAILARGLKAVIPDLIQALTVVESAL